jgi:hypothetical protein
MISLLTLHITPEQIVKSKCIDDTAVVPFFAVSIVAVFLLGQWIRREYRLSSWKTLLVMCGLVRVRRTGKLNVFQFLTVALPMFLAISLVYSNCDLP